VTESGIPENVRSSTQQIVNNFNRANLRSSAIYIARFKGKYLYLDRKDYGSEPAAICRLKYLGSLAKWEFAIFKHSSHRYDPEEFMFPGAAYLDGTIEGAMRCGLEAYPP
jgi:hypothetical protein